MSAQIKEALAALDRLQDLIDEHVATDAREQLAINADNSAVSSALLAAHQEAEAWEAIDEWCRKFNRTARTVRTGHATAVYLCLGDTVLSEFLLTPVLLIQAAIWCRAEMGK